MPEKLLPIKVLTLSSIHDFLKLNFLKLKLKLLELIQMNLVLETKNSRKALKIEKRTKALMSFFQKF